MLNKNSLNVELCSTTAKQHACFTLQLPLHPKVGSIPVNLCTCKYTCTDLPKYLQNSNWFLQRKRISASTLKWRQSANLVSGYLYSDITRPLRTFEPGQSTMPSTIIDIRCYATIIEFRRYVNEYSMNKFRLAALLNSVL